MDNSEEDDINELLALVEENDEEDAELDKAETSALEEEYLKLEKKMQEVRDKMKQKNSVSPKNTSPPQKSSKPTQNENDEASPSSKISVTENEVINDENKSPKSSFMAAFANAPFANSAVESLNLNCKKLKPKPSEQSFKRPSERSPLSELPPQKKRRVANITPGPTTHPFTENLRNNTQKVGGQNGNSAAKKGNQPPNTPVVVEIETFSRIRMKKCFVSGEEMQNRMKGKRYLKLSFIRSTMKISEETDWVTVGVVAKQLDRQTAKNGKPFSIWNITDLEDCTKTVAFFLFGAVYEKLVNQIGIGSVVGVLNPSIMPPKKDETQNAFDNTPALTVDVAERVMHIGISTDLGWCTATKWRNKQPAGKCLAFINKQVADVCVFHMKAIYKKSSARRSELQGSVAAPIAQKYKNTLWNKVKNDQFFYGGKVYSAAPSSAANTHKPVESKVKLTKFLSNHSNLAMEGKKELMERAKVMTALSGIADEHSVSGCSNAFADMLSSGDNVAGSRQYLNHLNNLKRGEEQKLKAIEGKPQTAAEFLKEQGTLIKSRKLMTLTPKPVTPKAIKTGSLLAQLKNNASTPKTPKSGPSYVSSADIKKMTSEMIKAKKLQLSKLTGSPKLGVTGPKLGQGSSSEEIDLFGDWSTPKNVVSPKRNADLAKKKAIAKLRTDSGKVSIKKKDPNRGVLKQIKNVRNNDKIKSNILQKVSENRCDMKENQENLLKKSPENSKYGKMSEDEFEKTLNSDSKYHSAVENSQLEEEEKYFSPLIRKEMMEKKMSETFEIPCKVVTCVECSYTFWAAHERCKELRHHLNWETAKKKFFQCSKCKCRTTTWETYPSKPCAECGSEKHWQRASMLREKDVKILDAEVLLIRGQEHGRFLNSMA